MKRPDALSPFPDRAKFTHLSVCRLTVGGGALPCLAYNTKESKEKLIVLLECLQFGAGANLN